MLPARLRAILFASMVLLAPVPAGAHPHQWVDAASEVLFDPQGRIGAIRHHWRFDEGFTAFALQGLDADGDGAYSAEELQPLAQENVESLAEFDFFTFLSVGDYTSGFGAPTDYHLDLEDGRLTLHFTLPLAQPLFSRSPILLQVYDPEYYIAFALPSREAVRLVDAPPACRLEVHPAPGLDANAAAQLATLGADQRELPPEMQNLADGIDNSAVIDCSGAAVAAPGAPTDAGAALSQLTVGPGKGGDLSALPAQTPAAGGAGDPVAAEAAARDAASRQTRAGPAGGGIMARLAALQGAFNAELTASLKSLSRDGSAFWWLGGLSFLYGIVHAAGPGHGKVVISSYLLANEQRLRRGVGIAFLSALVQALTAIGLVGLLALVLDMTSMAITGTARAFETGSFALVALLGGYLLVRKGRAAWAAFAGGDPHAGHAHHHHHHHPASAKAGAAAAPQRSAIRWEDAPEPHVHPPGCGCAHHAPPAALEKGGLAGAAAAVLSVGLRPCSGALVVLVFALAQGVFWAGIASTFLMGLGTAITVAALATLAVGAKGLARRLSAGDGRRAGQVMLALEVAAALLITVLGTALFAGSLAA